MESVWDQHLRKRPTVETATETPSWKRGDVRVQTCTTEFGINGQQPRKLGATVDVEKSAPQWTIVATDALARGRPSPEGTKWNGST